MDSKTAVVASERYSPNEGMTDEWIHPMPNIGEIVIRTISANWYVSALEDGSLEIRATNLPREPATRIVVKPHSANLLALEARYLGT